MLAMKDVHAKTVLKNLTYSAFWQRFLSEKKKIDRGAEPPPPHTHTHTSDLFFLIRLVGSGVQLGPLGTAATDWPIVPAAGDYDDGEFGGMKIGRGNRRLGENPPQRHLVHHKSH
jgi:hypothetical protein